MVSTPHSLLKSCRWLIIDEYDRVTLASKIPRTLITTELRSYLIPISVLWERYSPMSVMFNFLAYAWILDQRGSHNLISIVVAEAKKYFKEVPELYQATIEIINQNLEEKNSSFPFEKLMEILDPEVDIPELPLAPAFETSDNENLHELKIRGYDLTEIMFISRGTRPSIEVWTVFTGILSVGNRIDEIFTIIPELKIDLSATYNNGQTLFTYLYDELYDRELLSIQRKNKFIQIIEKQLKNDKLSKDKLDTLFHIRDELTTRDIR